MLFDNVRDWQKWKIKQKNNKMLDKKLKETRIKEEQKKIQLREINDKKWFDELVEKYGREFADWALQNRYKIRSPIISAGCKTEVEYRNKIAQDKGFNNNKERLDHIAQKKGYKNFSEQSKINMWNRGVIGNHEKNENCGTI